MKTITSPFLSKSYVKTPGESYQACQALCKAHYENFPVASRLVPGPLRGPIAVIYAFARIADDFADEPGWSSQERLRLLADWRSRLHSCQNDHQSHPVFWGLGDVMGRFQLPLDPFDRLITAFEMDVRQNRYAAFEDVLLYCWHSANPVGELVLRVFGAFNEQRGKWSDAICTALQLANFWQDVSVDALKDRLYVPLEDLKAFGVTAQDVFKGPAAPKLRDLISFQVERTQKYFDRGRSLCDDTPFWLRNELRLVWLGGTRVLEKIHRQNYDVWAHRPWLNKRDWLRLFWQCVFWTAKRA